MIEALINLSRFKKTLLMMCADVIIVPIALLLSFSFRFEELYKPEDIIMLSIILSPIIALPIFYIFDLYNSIIRFINFQFIWVITKCVSVYAASWGVIVLLIQIQGIPRSIIIINGLLCLILILSSRLIARNIIFLNSLNDNSDQSKKKNILIYGAGSAGIQLSNALNFSEEINQIAFIDDNISISNKLINGLKVYNSKNIKKVIKEKKIEEVFLAIPSISRSRRRQLISFLKKLKIEIKILPGLSSLTQGNIRNEDLREVNIEDLLGRNSVNPNIELIGKNINNKVVLVTGAAGSIGSEICRKIIDLKPKKLILFDNNEYFLYLTQNQLKKISDQRSLNFPIFATLGSVTDYERIALTCGTHNVETIYHAAAYKHVPMIEDNKIEGLYNNIFGTLNCVNAAISHKVETFVLISTDKAVRPSSIMGISKRYSEIIIQSLSRRENIHTKLMAVRFGNVLGSNGSVIPLFSQQISEGGPITITHPDVTRYFMTISEASELVIQAGAMGNGGEIFILNMGEPVLILDLAKKMISLSGLEIKNDDQEGDIEIDFIGLRDGEKLHEELVIDDNVTETSHEMIMCTQDSVINWDELKNHLNDLSKQISDNNEKEVIEKLKLVVKNSLI